MTGPEDAATLEPDDRLLGTLALGRYRVLRRIASGGMGTVYEAQHEQLGRRFALKFLNRDLDADPKMRVRFLREARAAGAVENEHVCAIVDVGLSPEDAPCIVMEYLDGENLAVLLESEGPLLVPRAVEMVRQVCRGLSNAHARGVIHRDLKPKNLIVCRHADGKELVKIVDFGIAKLHEPDVSSSMVTTTGTALGTPHYMSPEQARGEKELDQRADIYALGVILYELLSGQKPHPGDSYNAIIYHILSRTPVPLQDHRAEIPEPLARIVHRALASEPDDRFASALELEKALAPFGPTASERRGPGESTMTSAATVIAKPRRLRRITAGAGVVIAVGLVIAWRWIASSPAPAAVAPEPNPPTSTPPAAVAPSNPTPAQPAAPAESRAAQVTEPPKPAHTAPKTLRRPAASAGVPYDFSNPYQ